MNPLTSNIQKTAFPRQPKPFTLVEMMDIVKTSEDKCKKSSFFYAGVYLFV